MKRISHHKHICIIITRLFAVTALMMINPSPFVVAQPSSNPPHPNIQTAMMDSDAYEILNSDNNYVIKVDLSDRRVHPIVILPNDGNGGLQSLSGMKSQLQGKGYDHWLIINGDLFSSDCPAGVNCAQGLTYISGQRKDNWSAYDNTWMARGNIGFDSNSDVNISQGDGQLKRHMAIAGGPRVVIDGGSPNCNAVYNWDGRQKTRFDLSGEEFDGDARYWCTDTRPITMIGYSSDRKYLYVGISKGGKNMTQFAQWLKDRGASEILRFDSGSSTGMYFDNQFIGGTGGRAIANAFAIGIDVSAPNRPPNTPSPTSPTDWHIQRDGRAPTLCWNNPGDPDGDSVTFYAEVYDSASNANSGWIGSNCWRPSQLDGGYHGYQWRVKAKDTRGAESGWSSTWHFRIEPENLAPSISFNTANGNSSGEIASRDQTWTFAGTASDPEGQLREIKFHCRGDACNEDPTIGLNGNWSYQRSGLTGRNEVWFTACDDHQCAESRHVVLKIDLAAPTTTADVNGQTNPSGWFREPVNVTLRALDGATGNAMVGVREVRYRVNGGSWQSQGGGVATVPISSDGNHTVEYYAVDHLDNQESVKSIGFKIDATPPTSPGAASETHGVANDHWQKTQGTPEFTWDASSDATSGLQYYELTFGTDANGTDIQKFVGAGEARRWTPLPGGVRTGTYYLRARSRDIAGNYSSWVTLFVFRYDVTPPANPTSANHVNGITNNTWQRQSSLANFTWPPATDEGSGVNGYLTYWGGDANGMSADFRTTMSFQSAAPLCAANAACTGYLRLRSIDNVDNQANDWSSVFTLRYDGAPPTLDFTVNGGVTQTAQTLITLNLNAADQGSGLYAMRFSNDGAAWTEWETYATERLWQIPAIGRQSWPVYAQVRDVVGNESPVVMREVYFEVNRAQPRSDSYRLFDYAMIAGAGSHTSPAYTGRSTVGEVVGPGRATSAHFQLVGGYQAGSRAIPLVIPSHDEFTYINGIFASGIVNNTMNSGSFQMLATFGEPGLPNNVTTISSASYRHQPGFLAARPGAAATPTPTPIPGPTPTPEPPPACQFPTVSINDAAIFTNSPNVTIKLCAPRAAEMTLSNDGGFGGAVWEPYAVSKAWTLTTHGQTVLPRYVYAAFKDSQGNIFSTYLDDIIYDPTGPTGEIVIGDPGSGQLLAQAAAAGLGDVRASGTLSAFTMGDVTFVQRLGDQNLAEAAALVNAADDGVDVYLIAQDDNSGLAQMQLSENADFSSATWQPYDGLVNWMPTGGDGLKQLYTRFRDSAGNISDAFDASYLLDSHPPLGGVDIAEEIVGVNTAAMHLSFYSEDNLTGAVAMRVSESPDFADAPWQALTTELTWPVRIEADDWEKVIYAQFRDLAGNVSQTYSDAILVDREPPVVYMEVEPADSLERTVHVYAYDGLSALQTMRLTNDPFFIQGVTTLPYTEIVSWTVDERRVVWAQVIDGAGNASEPYPAYAAYANETPAPTATPVNSPTPGETPEQTPMPGETPTPGGGAYNIYLPSIQSGGSASAADHNNSAPLPQDTPTPIPIVTPQPFPAGKDAATRQIFVPIVADGRER